MQSIGWGVLATGKIATKVAADLALTPAARLAAVGSRSMASAKAFAATFGDDETTPYGSYEGLVADAAVDVVYIASPHALHLEHARLAFEAGKHVLCEKPLAVSVADAEEIIGLARQHDRFLMEAMWTACHPVVRHLATGLREGRFGAPRHLHAELGFVVDALPGDRLLDPALGAGAMLDMGIYPLTLAHLLLGEAEELAATASLAGTGIDLDIAVSGRYPGGALATMNASMTSWSSRAASIGTHLGRIDLADFHHPTTATFTPFAAGGTPDPDAGLPGHDEVGLEMPIDLYAEATDPTTGDPVIGVGYGNELAEVGRCVRLDLRESPLVPHTQTLTVMRQMEALLAQVGAGSPG